MIQTNICGNQVPTILFQLILLRFIQLRIRGTNFDLPLVYFQLQKCAENRDFSCEIRVFSGLKRLFSVLVTIVTLRLYSVIAVILYINILEGF